MRAVVTILDANSIFLKRQNRPFYLRKPSSFNADKCSTLLFIESVLTSADLVTSGWKTKAVLVNFSDLCNLSSQKPRELRSSYWTPSTQHRCRGFSSLEVKQPDTWGLLFLQQLSECDLACDWWAPFTVLFFSTAFIYLFIYPLTPDGLGDSWQQWCWH